MPINPRKERENINRRVYGKKTITKIKDIAKKKYGLLNVDHYTNKDKDILIERMIKGKQLIDESKSVILEHGRNAGLKLNPSMRKKNYGKYYIKSKTYRLYQR